MDYRLQERSIYSISYIEYRSCSFLYRLYTVCSLLLLCHIEFLLWGVSKDTSCLILSYLITIAIEAMLQLYP